jgi:hypothetical protein
LVAPLASTQSPVEIILQLPSIERLTYSNVEDDEEHKLPLLRVESRAEDSCIRNHYMQTPSPSIPVIVYVCACLYVLRVYIYLSIVYFVSECDDETSV